MIHMLVIVSKAGGVCLMDQFQLSVTLKMHPAGGGDRVLLERHKRQCKIGIENMLSPHSFIYGLIQVSPASRHVELEAFQTVTSAASIFELKHIQAACLT